MKAENPLSFATLRSTNLSRCARWHPRGLSEWSLSDWFTATLGELGEAANVAKKLNRERDNIAGNSESVEELRAHLADEIADTAIYLDILAASEGIDLAQAIASKFNRTSAKAGFPERLPDGTRCEHCGTPDHLARSEGCPPPFAPQPHAFNGKASRRRPPRATGGEAVKHCPSPLPGCLVALGLACLIGAIVLLAGIGLAEVLP